MVSRHSSGSMCFLHDLVSIPLQIHMDLKKGCPRADSSTHDCFLGFHVNLQGSNLSVGQLGSRGTHKASLLQPLTDIRSSSAVLPYRLSS